MAKVNPRITAVAIATAVAVAAPVATKWEGFVPKAKPDPVGILTGCYGETQDIDPSRIYSKDECVVKLRARMARDYAPPLVQCMPALAGPDWRRLTNVFGAMLDASYNTGPGPVCKRFAPYVNSGRYWEACNLFLGWYTTAQDRRTGVRKEFLGLVRRRNDEQALCLRNLP